MMSRLLAQRFPLLVVGVLTLMAPDARAAGGDVEARFGAAELDVLAADLRTQLKLSYRHSRPEYHRRLRGLEATAAAWSASSRSPADRDAVRRWLARAIRSSMPGSSIGMPAAPVLSRRRAETFLSTGPGVSAAADAPAQDRGASSTANPARADAASLIDRRLALRLWSESPAAAPLELPGGFASGRPALGKQPNALNEAVAALGGPGFSPTDRTLAEATTPTDKPFEPFEQPETPVVRATAFHEPAEQPGRLLPGDGSQRSAHAASGPSATQSSRGESVDPRPSTRQSLAAVLGDRGAAPVTPLPASLAVLGGAADLSPPSVDGLAFDLTPPELPLPTAELPSIADTRGLFAAGGATTAASRVTARKPAAFDTERLSRKIDRYNAALRRLRRAITSRDSPTAFQINLWSTELEQLGRERQLASLYLDGVMRGNAEGVDGFASPELVFALLRQRVDSRRESLAGLPAQAVRRELETLDRIATSLPAIEAEHAEEKAGAE